MIGSIDFSWNSLFVSCNLIGQFCLSDPGNSSRTVRTVLRFNVQFDVVTIHKANRTLNLKTILKGYG